MNSPHITDEHRRQAFALMRWPGWTFDAAMQHDMRRRLIECRAATIAAREREALSTATRQVVRRARLDEHGQLAGWCTQIVMGPREPSHQLRLQD